MKEWRTRNILNMTRQYLFKSSIAVQRKCSSAVAFFSWFGCFFRNDVVNEQVQGDGFIRNTNTYLTKGLTSENWPFILFVPALHWPKWKSAFHWGLSAINQLTTTGVFKVDYTAKGGSKSSITALCAPFTYWKRLPTALPWKIVMNWIPLLCEISD